MAVINLTLRALALLGLLLLFGCATPGSGPVWPYPEPPEGDWGYAPPSAPADDAEPAPTIDSAYAPPVPADQADIQPAISSHPTVQALVEQAEREHAAGDLERAAGTLERAIRIVNDDPLPWVRLAQLRFEQGNLIQAENLARRSLSFSARGAVARESWLLIADIKRLQGDAVAASDAEERARRF